MSAPHRENCDGTRNSGVCRLSRCGNSRRSKCSTTAWALNMFFAKTHIHTHSVLAFFLFPNFSKLLALSSASSSNTFFSNQGPRPPDGLQFEAYLEVAHAAPDSIHGGSSSRDYPPQAWHKRIQSWQGLELVFLGGATALLKHWFSLLISCQCSRQTDRAFGCTLTWLGCNLVARQT